MNLFGIDLSSIILIGGLCLGGLIFIGVVLPAIGHLIFGFELVGILIDAIGEYIGNKRLAQLGCLALIGLSLACLCGVAALAVGLATCVTGNPSNICRLIGH